MHPASKQLRAIMAFSVIAFMFSETVWSEGDLPSAQPDQQRIQELREHFGLTAFTVRAGLKKIKIAVLDDGFGNYDPGQDTVGILPSETKPIVVDRYSDELFDHNRQYFEDLGVDQSYWQDSFTYGAREMSRDDRHGLYLAQGIWKLTGGYSDGPQFYLLNARGASNFFSAIAFAVEQKVDLIVFAQNYYYGNGAGDGFIDQAVSYATDRGILWINAAGNVGGSVYTGKIRFDSEGYVFFQHDRNYLEIETHKTEQNIRLTATWTDQWNKLTRQSTKDLDVIVYRVKNENSGVEEENLSGDRGRKRQSLNREDTSGAATLYAKEEFQITLPTPGKYRIRVQAMSDRQEFTSHDFIRIVLNQNHSSTDVDFIDATHEKELFEPADHPGVLTVGSTDKFSAQGPTLSEPPLHKPEIILDRCDLKMDNGLESIGTSEASAYFAAILAVLKAQNPALDHESVLRLIKSQAASANTQTLQEAVPSIILQELQRVAGVSPQQIRFERNSEGRRILYLPVEPSQISAWFHPLFKSELFLISRNQVWQSAHPVLVSTPFGPQWMAAPQTDTQETVSAVSGLKPNVEFLLDRLEIDVTGKSINEKHWIELRYAGSSTYENNTDENGNAIWVTPTSARLDEILRSKE